ncbi:four-carbon acid sugar kinase family protein [Jiella sp. M17.18]|uniref:four-carbon acid sugar kinase family protein n=1 Tax=Jiella sp. M17.18 TaxID=3234247 RepID=UPI0034E027B1
MDDLRILADDLSGALDTAVCFSGGHKALLVTRSSPVDGVFGCSSGARDLAAEAAAKVFVQSLPWLLSVGHPFHKLDSRLRGYAAHEIAAVRRAAPDRPIVVAPALPVQQRIMRSGRLYSRDSAAMAWALEPADISRQLAALGETVELCSSACAAVPEGISLWDAEIDADLDRIAAAALARPGAILCGSSGLAAALARALGISQPPRIADFTPPMLLIAGTAHPQTLRQVARVSSRAAGIHRPVATDAATFADVAMALADGRSQLITPRLPAGLEAEAIAAAIALWIGRAVHELPRPGSLFVTGGETLDVLTQALGAKGLLVEGQVAAGVPASRFLGGVWDGLPVISKSGGFGAVDLLVQLVIDEV